MAPQATNVVVNQVVGQDNTLSATWSWNKENTDHFTVRWNYAYDTYGGKQNWTYQETTVPANLRSSTFSIPAQAVRVSCQVLPVAKTHKVNNEDVAYWTAVYSALWSDKGTPNPNSVWYKSDYRPLTEVPSVPSVTVDGYYLTAEVTGIPAETDASGVHFEIDEIRNRSFGNDAWSILYKHEFAWFASGRASVKIPIELGKQYVVRARFYRERSNEYGPWSEWSGYQKTMPAKPAGFTVCRAQDKTVVYLEWNAVDNADRYDVEFATKLEYFDGSDQTQIFDAGKGTHYQKTGLESGNTYYFRLRAVNDTGESEWSAISSTVIGTTPEPPTTWSSTTTAVVGERVILYWVHNCEDGSKQRKAELVLDINGTVETIEINAGYDDDKIRTSQYEIDTSNYRDGFTLKWKVRTWGVVEEASPYSIERTIDVYAPPTLALSVIYSTGELVETLRSFPFYVLAQAGPKSQKPIGYHVTVSTKDSYETVNDYGNPTIVLAGAEIYSKYFDIDEDLMVEFSAGNVNLETGQNYRITVQVTMNSGLTTEETYDFSVGWVPEEYELNAEIGVNMEQLTASIRPYLDIPQDYMLYDSSDDPILDSEGNPISCEKLIPMMMSVYRREYDGSFTVIMTGIDNRKKSFVTDPHPALDFARYRIVGKTLATGSVSFYDVPGIPVKEEAAVIQWDEAWSEFDSTSPEMDAIPAWSGSMLKLPWNIDLSDNKSRDVAYVAYQGRKHPVSYFGTQLGETASLNLVIDKQDKETLYAIRRLAVWMGNVYVREPSGSGYWASADVSFSQKHTEVTIPVKINLTRVEGGM